jgi:glycosyltransferase involved in cell wall biosynthesis
MPAGEIGMEGAVPGPSDGSRSTGVRILAVSRGDPYSSSSFSGATVNLLRALNRRGAFGVAVDARPSRVAELASLGLAARRDREAWRQQSLLSISLRRQLTRNALRRAGAHVEAAPDVLQIGAWFDLAGLRPRARILCSYNDGNTADMLKRPDLLIPADSRSAGRALGFERRVADGLDRIFTLSEHLRRSFIEDLGQPAERVIAVGAGANLARIPDAVSRTGTRPTFLFVGKQFIRKGGDTVIRAFRTVRDRVPDAELMIVGPAEPPPDPGAGVVFVGPVDRSTPQGDRRMEDLYRAATTFVMPSVFEPFGIVFLEAMANRLPCIGSTRGAMPEIIAHGDTGFVVPPGDHDALAAHMLELATSPGTAARMGEAGYRRFLERYTWDAVALRIHTAMTEAARETGRDTQWVA